MKNKVDVQSDIMFEHRFWLQILGDHARFIHQSLAPKETREIEQASHFIKSFDKLLEYARQNLSGEDIHLLNQQASLFTEKLREFKLHLLERHLVGKIAISLPPTFLNHMVNELEEYERILNDVLSGSGAPTFHAVHYHLLWLSDAAGHAATISSLLDMVEHDYKQKSHHFTKQFEHFYLKAVELAGYLRTHLQSFPALSRFHHQAEMEIQLFQSFLHELTEMRLRDEVLGVLSPLMADHMSREECYYLMKLSEVSDVKMPDCYPTRPRIEQ
ncbi:MULTISPECIES: DUF2935 domain-containing protein [Brevibacillus]|jgi:hypothetical protein|uniref:DUF2935 domain-containing protein n=1 Tax=Brevibacillus TaxID=55080 RepID=UPI001D0A437B|nr:DUF2935 domain-containing protein [Brevibacillus borstelensis]MCC0562864.1 DUF2935 domain-containing protein [Brevibacillus borstelensis]MCM3470313.1 DUF2935 domain-containing protein [Brevibacillus borstelensis]MCM3592410.1 DUF2935 domain-containing protein [Brevibacillus borstelensis]MED1853244.1 DUF2935 domain-containing protein [Brevibacillus borstelensis]MED2009343.1 DUF2935 domain-containing protein [Brevibacillus borstelensis]